MEEQADMSAIKFVPILTADYIKFVQRLLSFYSYNFKQATADIVDEEQMTLEEEIELELSGTQTNKRMVFPRNTTLVVESKLRLDYLVHRIIPDCKVLKKLLKQKRKYRKHRPGSRERYNPYLNDQDFPYDDENVIYIVLLKILESYYLQFEEAELVASTSR